MGDRSKKQKTGVSTSSELSMPLGESIQPRVAAFSDDPYAIATRDLAPLEGGPAGIDPRWAPQHPPAPRPDDASETPLSRSDSNDSNVSVFTRPCTRQHAGDVPMMMGDAVMGDSENNPYFEELQARFDRGESLGSEEDHAMTDESAQPLPPFPRPPVKYREGVTHPSEIKLSDVDIYVVKAHGLDNEEDIWSNPKLFSVPGEGLEEGQMVSVPGEDNVYLQTFTLPHEVIMCGPLAGAGKFVVKQICTALQPNDTLSRLERIQHMHQFHPMPITHVSDPGLPETLLTFETDNLYYPATYRCHAGTEPVLIPINELDANWLGVPEAVPYGQPITEGDTVVLRPYTQSKRNTSRCEGYSSGAARG